MLCKLKSRFNPLFFQACSFVCLPWLPSVLYISFKLFRKNSWLQKNIILYLQCMFFKTDLSFSLKFYFSKLNSGRLIIKYKSILQNGGSLS